MDNHTRTMIDDTFTQGRQKADGTTSGQPGILGIMKQAPQLDEDSSSLSGNVNRTNS
jgi:hypothetical protein